MNYWYIPKRRIKRHRTRLSTVDVTPWARFYISKVVDPFGNFSGVMGQSELITYLAYLATISFRQWNPYMS